MDKMVCGCSGTTRKLSMGYSRVSCAKFGRPQQDTKSNLRIKFPTSDGLKEDKSVA